MERFINRTTIDYYRTEANIPKWLMFLFCGYIFLSYFETYLTVFIGSSTKFYLLFLIFLFLCVYRFHIRLNSYSIFFVAWFIFKCVSILWSDMSNTNVSTHFLSQIGMVLLLLVMVGQCQKGVFLNYIIKANYWCSFLHGILTIIFQDSYISETFEARKVLTLFGKQNDPNNGAAFLVVGFALSIYAIIYERKRIFLNILVALVNLYAIMLSASRTGFVTVVTIIMLFVLLPTHMEKFEITGYLRRIVIVVLVSVIGLYVVQKYLPIASFERLFNFSGYVGGSSRTERWKQAMEFFWSSPIIGCGWGGYILEGFGSATSIHNTFITSLCDGGIIGTALLIIPLIKLVFEALKKKNNIIIFLLACGLCPSFFIDAINKRFFWNAIIIGIMLINHQRDTGNLVGLWKDRNYEELS